MKKSMEAMTWFRTTDTLTSEEGVNEAIKRQEALERTLRKHRIRAFMLLVNMRLGRGDENMNTWFEAELKAAHANYSDLGTKPDELMKLDARLLLKVARDPARRSETLSFIEELNDHLADKRVTLADLQTTRRELLELETAARIARIHEIVRTTEQMLCSGRLTYRAVGHQGRMVSMDALNLLAEAERHLRELRMTLDDLGIFDRYRDIVLTSVALRRTNFRAFTPLESLADCTRRTPAAQAKVSAKLLN